jgi:hypothetical protein
MGPENVAVNMIPETEIEETKMRIDGEYKLGVSKLKENNSQMNYLKNLQEKHQNNAIVKIYFYFIYFFILFFILFFNFLFFYFLLFLE